MKEELNDDAVDDAANCLVCYEEFEGSGDHLPRILPCSHTFCEKCLGNLFQFFTNTLDCPQCRVRHKGGRLGVKTFPQNKYILRHLKDKKESRSTGTTSEGTKNSLSFDFDQCKEHSRDEIFFCTEVGCEKNICPVCMLKKHKTHNVIDIVNDQKEKRQAVISDLEPLLESLVDMQEKIVRKEGKLKIKYEECKNKIFQSKKRELNRLAESFDKLLLKLEIQWDETKMYMCADKSIIDDSIKEVTDFQTTVKEETMSALPIICLISKVKTMKVSKKTEERRYKFLEYREAGDQGEKLDERCGSLVEKLARVPTHGVPDCTGKDYYSTPGYDRCSRGSIKLILSNHLMPWLD